MIKSLMKFQDDAVSSGLEVFRAAQDLLAAAGVNEAGRSLAVNHNGYLLIEAPTGSGKTLIAGTLIERFSQIENVVWFWFAPFKGVVGQSSQFLRGQFHGLRLRDLATDRNPEMSRAGDVFVTTWQTVATRVTDNRNVRKEAETNPSIDGLISDLRDKGFRIGVVVDEAHHSFGEKTQASQFFRDVLSPEYTVLVTATPDDKEILAFEKAMGSIELHRIQVSREDGVEVGLLKKGVKCVAYFADPADRNMVDLQQTALRDGVTTHRAIKRALGELGVNLTPLLLVQADSQKSVGAVKEKLLAMGFTDDQVATHTSNEPDAGLLALANDERREVLVFVMAVALGFDAPRAFNLVSMRASKKVEFGVQLVGRIMRVHQRLHALARQKKLPESLNCGYVFLADPETQSGLDQAGQVINEIKTSFASVSKVLAATSVGVVRASPEGQAELFPAELGETPGARSVVLPDGGNRPGEPFDLGALFDLDPIDVGGKNRNKPSSDKPSGHRYPLREGMPSQFMTQIVSSDSLVTEEACAKCFMVPATDQLDRLLSKAKVERRSLEIFTRQLQQEFEFDAELSDERAALLAQRALMRNQSFDPKMLRRALLLHLKDELVRRDFELVEGDLTVVKCLNVILAMNPAALFEAQKQAVASTAQVFDAAPIPAELVYVEPQPVSARNVYGCYPQGLNPWERKFAELLDGDSSQMVQWWHRNEPHKPWSVNVLMPNGKGFFPDFLVGIKGRPKRDNVLLTDPKHRFEMSSEAAKIEATHREYGRVAILALDGGQWRVVGVDAKTQKAKAERAFRLSEMVSF